MGRQCKNAIKDYKNTKSTANKSIKKNGIPNFMINNECIYAKIYDV